MGIGSREKALERPFSSSLSWTLSLLLVAVVAVLDFLSTPRLVVPVLYVVPLVLGIQQRRRWVVWCLALICVVLDFAVYYTRLIDADSFALPNRVLAAAAILSMAAICHVLVAKQQAGAEHLQRLGERTAGLEIAGLELAAREEKMDRDTREASIQKTDFLAALSHAIRTPVNAINLMAEVMRRTAANPALEPDIPQLAERLQANAVSLVELINDLLDIARPEQGKVVLQETEFDLSDVIAEECGRLTPLAQEKRLHVLIEPQQASVVLHTDRTRLARILRNLLGNAIKFTESGCVRVSSVLRPDRRVEIRFADTGIGIAPEHLAHIFEEFTQLHNPERDRSKGCGLGLAISKRLTEALGGLIAVDSQPGRGTTMTVTLPARAPAGRWLPGTASGPPVCDRDLPRYQSAR